MDNATLQLGYVFTTISVIMPTFITSLGVPYLLEVWNAVCREVDAAAEGNILFCLNYEREKLEASIDTFRSRMWIEIAILALFCFFSFIVGICIVAGWLSSLPGRWCRWQIICGIMSSLLIASAGIVVAKYSRRVACLLERYPIRIKRWKISVIEIVVILIFVVIGIYWFSLYVLNLRFLMAVMLFVQVILLGMCVAIGQLSKPVQRIDEFRIKRLTVKNR